MNEFIEFPKISRFSREVVVTEKIDGTNGQIIIGEDGSFSVGSRTRIITPETDNHGFARWAYDHKDELMLLGHGRHFGEWWGLGIQRNYGMREKAFSLFNVKRWGDDSVRPKCCRVVPVLWRGEMDELNVRKIMYDLFENGSSAYPFMNPEGIVIRHLGGAMFKKTFGPEDSSGKGKEPEGKQLESMNTGPTCDQNKDSSFAFLTNNIPGKTMNG